jgi:hypothetical protein
MAMLDLAGRDDCRGLRRGSFRETAANATVIFSWSIGGQLLERVFAIAPRVL